MCEKKTKHSWTDPAVLASIAAVIVSVSAIYISVKISKSSAIITNEQTRQISYANSLENLGMRIRNCDYWNKEYSRQHASVVFDLQNYREEERQHNEKDIPKVLKDRIDEKTLAYDKRKDKRAQAYNQKTRDLGKCTQHINIDDLTACIQAVDNKWRSWCESSSMEVPGYCKEVRDSDFALEGVKDPSIIRC